jgi:hypothetical protein
MFLKIQIPGKLFLEFLSPIDLFGAVYFIFQFCDAAEVLLIIGKYI